MTGDPIPTGPWLGDPLPQRRRLAIPAAGGAIKERAEDFVVDEIPLYEPCGEGEHLYLRVQKRGLAHHELVSLIARHYRVGEVAVGFAGMKDKVGVTQQTLSVHLPDGSTPAPLEHPRVAVLWAARHLNKLRRGHLVGNRFSIRIRRIDPLKAPAVLRHLRALERSGIPDYFGFQRFGYRRNNHRLGLFLLQGDHEGLLRELLGSHGSPSPDHQRERRELFDAGKLADALPLWAAADRAERAAIAEVARGAPAERAVRAIGPQILDFWVSALQSFVFNRTLDRRIDAGLLDALLDGDVAWRHGRGSTFVVGASELEGSDLAERLARFEISPSGPLPGRGMRRAEGRPAALEAEALAAERLDAALFDRAPYGAEGVRRPFRVQVSTIECDSGFDEHGPFVRVAFDLPLGAYATVVIRELIGDDGSTAL